MPRLSPIRTWWIVILTAATIAAAASADAQQPGGAGPTLDDLFSVSGLDDPQLSPDGRTVVYTLHATILAENLGNADLWRVPVAGGPPVQLTLNPGADHHPRWRPDGGEVAFLSVRAPDDPKSAIYAINPVGGEPRRLYTHAASIDAFEWSPDGRWIAFAARDQNDSLRQATVRQGRDVRIEDAPGGYVQIWVMDADTGNARQVTRGRDRTVLSFAWSPDSRSIAFSASTTDQPGDWHSDLYVVDAHDTTASPRLVTTGPGSRESPVWTPDGGHLVYTGSPGGEVNIGYGRLYRVPAAGGAAEDISPKADLEPMSYVLAPHGRGLFFDAFTGTTRELFYLPLSTRVPVRLTTGSGVYSAPSVTRDGRRAVFLYESPAMPPELYTAPLASSPAAGSVTASARLTAHNAHAASFPVGRTEVMRWRSVDGREVEGVVVHRPGPARPGPLVVDIHGGPSGVWAQNFQAAGLFASAHLFAADGYTVLLPNPRGSHGYGDAAQRLADWGQLDYQDIQSGVDALIQRDLAHPDSLAVMGWSYGGFMSAWTITQTPRFKAAVVGAGITEPITMWGTQDLVHYYEAFFGGSPFAEGAWDAYNRTSPLSGVGRVRTPTLIIHGTEDPRVPPNQGLLFYRALRSNGVAAELVWLPRTEHVPTEPGLRYETVRRAKEWIDQWVRSRARAPEVVAQP